MRSGLRLPAQTKHVSALTQIWRPIPPFRGRETEAQKG